MSGEIDPKAEPMLDAVGRGYAMVLYKEYHLLVSAYSEAQSLREWVRAALDAGGGA